MIERAEAVAAGTRPMKKDRFRRSHRRRRGRGLGSGRTSPLPRRSEGLCHQHRPRHPGRPVRSEGLPRALPGRTIIPVTKSDLAAQPMAPDPRQHRGPPHHRVRRTSRSPARPEPGRRRRQEDHPDPTAAAQRHHQPRHPTDHRPTTHPGPGASHPRRPHPGWSLNRYNSGRSVPRSAWIGWGHL